MELPFPVRLCHPLRPLTALFGCKYLLTWWIFFWVACSQFIYSFSYSFIHGTWAELFQVIDTPLQMSLWCMDISFHFHAWQVLVLPPTSALSKDMLVLLPLLSLCIFLMAHPSLSPLSLSFLLNFILFRYNSLWYNYHFKIFLPSTWFRCPSTLLILFILFSSVGARICCEVYGSSSYLSGDSEKEWGLVALGLKLGLNPAWWQKGKMGLSMGLMTPHGLCKTLCTCVHASASMEKETYKEKVMSNALIKWCLCREGKTGKSLSNI